MTTRFNKGLSNIAITIRLCILRCMKKLRQVILLLTLGLFMGLPMSALAMISSQQASDIARQQIPGRVLAVEQSQHHGRVVYRIKILSDRGEVHILLIDANSGQRIGN